jgi:hypothetical protein
MDEIDIEISEEGQRLIDKGLHVINRTKHERLENQWWVEIGLIFILVTAAISLFAVIMTTLTVLGRIKDMSFVLIITSAMFPVSFLAPLFFYLSYLRFSSKARYFERLADDIEEEMRFSQSQ